jgi:hypothetical protein
MQVQNSQMASGLDQSLCVCAHKSQRLYGVRKTVNRQACRFGYTHLKDKIWLKAGNMYVTRITMSVYLNCPAGLFPGSSKISVYRYVLTYNSSEH